MPKVTRHSLAMLDERDYGDPLRGILDHMSVDEYDEAMSGRDAVDYVVGDVVATRWGTGRVIKVGRNNVKVQLDDGGEPLSCPAAHVKRVDVIARLAELMKKNKGL